MIKKKKHLSTPELAGLMLASFFMFIGCQNNSKPPGEPYLFVAEDFSELAVESSPSIPENEFSERFQVFVLNDSGRTRQGQKPIAGRYEMNDHRLIFRPSFPFSRGNTYRIRFNTGEKWLERDFYKSSLTGPASTQVANVYPTIKFLPQNLLKFYIQFTDSMARGFAYDHIHFVSENGDTIRDVFLPLEQELWSQDMKRFTLLLDPGRIKRGLGSQDELGYPFELRKKYRMIIESGWRDAHNRPLTDDFTREFMIYPEVRYLAGDYNITEQPASGSLDPVVIRSKRPHDFALMQSAIWLTDGEGNEVAGSVSIERYELAWKFVPEKPWKASRYNIRIGHELEDLAGNNLVNLFDVDNRKDSTTPSPDGPGYYQLSFWPK